MKRNGSILDWRRTPSSRGTLIIWAHSDTRRMKKKTVYRASQIRVETEKKEWAISNQMGHIQESPVVLQYHQTLLFVPHREIIDYGGQQRHNPELQNWPGVKMQASKQNFNYRDLYHQWLDKIITEAPILSPDVYQVWMFYLHQLSRNCILPFLSLLDNQQFYRLHNY